jgi:hypothetical protein
MIADNTLRIRKYYNLTAWEILILKPAGKEINSRLGVWMHITE